MTVSGSKIQCPVPPDWETAEGGAAAGQGWSPCSISVSWAKGSVPQDAPGQRNPHNSHRYELLQSWETLARCMSQENPSAILRSGTRYHFPVAPTLPDSCMAMDLLPHQQTERRQTIRFKTWLLEADRQTQNRGERAYLLQLYLLKLRAPADYLSNLSGSRTPNIEPGKRCLTNGRASALTDSVWLSLRVHRCWNHHSSSVTKLESLRKIGQSLPSSHHTPSCASSGAPPATDSAWPWSESKDRRKLPSCEERIRNR